MDEFVWRPLKKLHDELVKNCGKIVEIFICCCEDTMTFVGFITQVGENFVELRVDCNHAQALVVIPLTRIDSFTEDSTHCKEHHQHRCRNHMNFRDKIDEFRGHCVTVPICRCDEVKVPTGVLDEVAADFLKLRNFDNTGRDLIVKLSSVCAVETFINKPPAVCHNVHSDLSHAPYVK